MNKRSIVSKNIIHHIALNINKSNKTSSCLIYLSECKNNHFFDGLYH